MNGNARDRDSAAGALFYHGGNRGAARLAFPGAETPLLDLSTGINPVPYPVRDIPADDWTRLPEPADVDALADAAALAYGVPESRAVVAAPGTQALLQWLPLLRPARRVGVLGFTYAEHERCWQSAGAAVDVVADLAALDGFDVAVVVNPNNPDGRLTPRADLLTLASRMDRHGGLLVVDEAFMDVMPDGCSVASEVMDVGNVLVLRSFGKTYGLAGARLGFAITETGLAKRVRDALGPWAVSGPALTLGCRALADLAWLEETRARLASDTERLSRILAQAGLQAVGGTPLFTLAEHGEAHALFERLGRRGILVRAFAGAPRWLRFGLPPSSSWPLLEERLARL